MTGEKGYIITKKERDRADRLLSSLGRATLTTVPYVDILDELEKEVRAIKCQEEDLWLIELVLKKITNYRKQQVKE